MYKLTPKEAIPDSWDQVTSLNYQLKESSPQSSVVYAEILGEHGQVSTTDRERVYYILEGEGEFKTGSKTLPVVQVM